VSNVKSGNVDCSAILVLKFLLVSIIISFFLNLLRFRFSLPIILVFRLSSILVSTFVLLLLSAIKIPYFTVATVSARYWTTRDSLYL